jgi:hypothetical protein
MAKIFYTPSGYSGNAELTATTGLNVIDQGRWRFSQAGYNDQATFGLSIGWPDKTTNGIYSDGPGQVPALTGGLLALRGQDWPIAVVGNELTSYTDPDTGDTYPASQCRISVTGAWNIIRQPNSNSYNSFGTQWSGLTQTDQGDREMYPWLLNYSSNKATYVIQGADVTGGARDTFSSKIFECSFTESVTSVNSNKEFQSNTIIRPAWVYSYSKSWEIDA